MLLLVGSWGANAEAPRHGANKTLAPAKVLYIGNSYTYYHSMPAIVSAMARAKGSPRELDNVMVTKPGATLQDHWESGRVMETIRERDWDFVVIQEHSLGPLDRPDAMLQYAKLIGSTAGRNGTSLVLFVTWPRRDRPETYAALYDAYRTVANELGASLAPVGLAWQIARQRSPQLGLYEEDGSHPTEVGSYLTACVLYMVLQSSGRECPAVPYPGVSEAAGAVLRSAAAAAVFQSR